MSKDIVQALFEASYDAGLYPQKPVLFMDYNRYIIGGNPLAAVADGDGSDLTILRNKTTGGLEIEPYGPNTVAGGGSIPIQGRFQNEGVRDLPSQFTEGFVTNSPGSLDNTTWIQNEFNDKTFLSSLFSNCPCNGDIGDGSGPIPPVETQTGYGGIGFGNTPNQGGSGTPSGSGSGSGNPFGGGPDVPSSSTTPSFP